MGKIMLGHCSLHWNAHFFKIPVQSYINFNIIQYDILNMSINIFINYLLIRQILTYFQNSSTGH